MTVLDSVWSQFGLAELEEIKVIKKISQATKLPAKQVIVVIAVLSLTLMIVSSYVRTMVDALTTFVYPAYKSFKALERNDTNKESKWLDYWIIFAFFQFFDNILVGALKFYPILSILQTIILNVLQLKGNKAVYFLYGSIIGPTFHKIDVKYGQTIRQIESVLFGGDPSGVKAG